MNRSYKRSVHLFLKCISLTFKGSIVLSNESIHKESLGIIDTEAFFLPFFIGI